MTTRYLLAFLFVVGAVLGLRGIWGGDLQENSCNAGWAIAQTLEKWEKSDLSERELRNFRYRLTLANQPSLWRAFRVMAARKAWGGEEMAKRSFLLDGDWSESCRKWTEDHPGPVSIKVADESQSWWGWPTHSGATPFIEPAWKPIKNRPSGGKWVSIRTQIKGSLPFPMTFLMGTGESPTRIWVWWGGSPVEVVARNTRNKPGWAALLVLEKPLYYRNNQAQCEGFLLWYAHEPPSPSWELFVEGGA